MPARLKSLKPNESGIQRTIIEGLTALGFLVITTSRRPRKCPQCGAWGRSGAGDGVSKGCPDLFFTRRDGSWGNRWIGAEIKGPRTRVSPEQQALADAGAVFIWRSWEEALVTVRPLQWEIG